MLPETRGRQAPEIVEDIRRRAKFTNLRLVAHKLGKHFHDECQPLILDDDAVQRYKYMSLSEATRSSSHSSRGSGGFSFRELDDHITVY